MRTIIEIPQEVIRTLDRIGEQERKSRAAIIRKAIHLYLDGRALTESEAGFGVWKEKGIDGLRYQEQLRSEWGR